MSHKIIVLLAVALCGLQSANAAEADFEVLNFAISDPQHSNPQVVADSVLNIIGSFIPQMPAPAPTLAPAPTAAPPAPTAVPTAAPPAPTPPPPTAAPFVFPPFPFVLPQPQPQPQPQPIVVVPSNPQVVPANCKPEPPCSKKKNSVAEFLVNVPCPTTTTTPKPIKQIIVKVPCPTTKKPTCECQCCPCNPCKPKKKKVQKPVSKESCEESSSEEVKTVYKSYDPVMKKYVNTRGNNVNKQLSSYEPRGDYRRTQVQNDEYWYKK